MSSEQQGERIAKVMARAGLASRRRPRRWIAAGRVSVNGAVIASPALNVTAADRISVDGKPLPQRERTRLFLYHKPRGLVTTHSDPQGRPTIFGALPKNLPRLISVGRLDLNTEGLLLLTNDGELARVLELPQTGWLRRYRVRALGRVTQEALDALRERRHRRRRALRRRSRRRSTASRAPMSGSPSASAKARTAKCAMCSSISACKVNRLIRVSFGPFELGELERGDGRGSRRPIRCARRARRPT